MKYQYLPSLLIFAAVVLISSCHSPAGTDEAGSGAGMDSTVNTAARDSATSNTDTLTTQKKDTSSTIQKIIKPLTVIIDNLESATAPVEISIYGKDNKFPSPKDQLKIFRFHPSGKKLVATLDGIRCGQYAIATYQDLDGDGKIGKNMIGIPTDPYGFSNNYHPKVKAPNFSDCSFDYDEASNTVNITMIR